MKILLDYFFPITTIEPTPAANTAFLKQVLILVAPKADVTPGTITLCTSVSAVAALTDNTDAEQLFNAGMNRVFVLPTDDLDVKTQLESSAGSQFFTVLVSSDFDETDVATMDVGAFKGVVGVWSTDLAFLRAQAVIQNRVAMFSNSTNKAKNMFFAFGKLLSNQLNWLNQQYIQMPLGDGVTALGDANALFDDRISFVLSDSEFGQRLGLFIAGGKAIVAPYIKKNLEIDLQSQALSYVSANQPQYSLTQAALLEDELQKVVDRYIERRFIEFGQAEVKLEQANFVASGYFLISEPKALWRIFGQINQTI